MQSRTPSSILVIRLSSLGDVILATPVVRVLRARFPQARIDVAVAQEFAEVWAGNPYVDTVLKLDRRRSALHGLFRASLAGALSRYDVVIDEQNNMRSFVLRKRFGKSAYVVDSMRARKRALLRHDSTAEPLPHVVQRYLDALEPLGVGDDGDGLDLWNSDGTHASVRTQGTEGKHKGRGVVVIAPGAKHVTKQWPAQRYAECAQRLMTEGYEVVLLGAMADAAVCEEIQHGMTGFAREKAEYVQTTSLAQTIRIMRTATCVVANDSSSVHMAAACRVPVVDIYGSTVPALGFTPYRCENTIVEHDVACRPCTHIGRSECPKHHFQCMNGIGIASVVEAVVRYGSYQGSG